MHKLSQKLFCESNLHITGNCRLWAVEDRRAAMSIARSFGAPDPLAPMAICPFQEQNVGSRR
jgi:hypothetical protein